MHVLERPVDLVLEAHLVALRLLAHAAEEVLLLELLRLLDGVQAALDCDAGPGAGAATQGADTEICIKLRGMTAEY